MSQVLIAGLLGFALGSLPSGYLLVAALGRGDVRKVGSGNIGATNVGRVLGRPGWTATLLLDAGKGALAVWLAGLWLSGAPAAAAAGFGAILGHCFTPWLSFRGGKGVATMIGVFLVLAPIALLPALIVFALVVVVSRMVSAGSLAAVVALPVAAWRLGFAPSIVLAAAATALLVIVRHRANVSRIMAGEEARIGSKPA